MRYFQGKQTDRMLMECVACFVYNHFTCSRVYIRERYKQRMKSKQTGEEAMRVVVHKVNARTTVYIIRMSIAVVSGYVASIVRTEWALCELDRCETVRFYMLCDIICRLCCIRNNLQ